MKPKPPTKEKTIGSRMKIARKEIEKIHQALSDIIRWIDEEVAQIKRDYGHSESERWEDVRFDIPSPDEAYGNALLEVKEKLVPVAREVGSLRWKVF